MARHAVINKDGRVVNVIIWDGAEFLAPRDHYVVQSDLADIGDSYDFKSLAFTKPVVE